jgi:ribosome-associated protein
MPTTTTHKVAPDPALINVEPSIEELLKIIHTAIDDKKGEQITILDLSGVVDYLDYLVICSGQTEIQNRAIADNIIEALGRYGIEPDALSGHTSGQWILLDYGVLVVHIFQTKLREYYRLEELWAGGAEVRV